MSSSAVETAPSAAAPRPFLQSPVGRAVQALASLRLTVVLFARKQSDWAWIELADFNNAGLKNITRIAVSPKGDRIAVVARLDPVR